MNITYYYNKKFNFYSNKLKYIFYKISMVANKDTMIKVDLWEIILVFLKVIIIWNKFINNLN